MAQYICKYYIQLLYRIIMHWYAQYNTNYAHWKIQSTYVRMYKKYLLCETERNDSEYTNENRMLESVGVKWAFWCNRL